MSYVTRLNNLKPGSAKAIKAELPCTGNPVIKLRYIEERVRAPRSHRSEATDIVPEVKFGMQLGIATGVLKPRHDKPTSS